MSGFFGWGELFLIGFVVVVIFSAARMGALGNAVGKFVYSFKKASRGNDLVDGKVTRTQPKREDAQVMEERKDR